MALETITAGVKILGGLKGLFGKKAKAPTPRDNIMSQAQGARDAAEAYGFNPLTMLQFGNPGGAIGGGGGAPPLASLDVLTSGLSDLSDITSGDAAMRRASNQLELDLGKLKLEQLRAAAAAPSVGSGPSAFGRSAVKVPGPDDAGFKDPAGNDITRLAVNGTIVTPDIGFSDAELGEQRWGELGGSLMGLPVLAADMARTAQTKRNQEANVRLSERFDKRKPSPFVIRPSPAFNDTVPSVNRSPRPRSRAQKPRAFGFSFNPMFGM